MTKDELLERLKKENESTVARLNPTTMGTYARGMGYSDGLGYAVGLVEKLKIITKMAIQQMDCCGIHRQDNLLTRNEPKS